MKKKTVQDFYRLLKNSMIGYDDNFVMAVDKNE